VKLSDVRDKFKGETIFIVGSGPSVHHTDTSILKGKICLAVNSGLLKYKDIDFYGFISDDHAVRHWNYYRLLEKMDCVKFLFKDKLGKYSKKFNNVCLFKHKSWFSPPNKYHLPHGLEITKEEPIIGARVSSGSAVHIAYILGAKKIVLIGNDCRMREGKRYFWEYPGEEKGFRTNGDNSFKTNKRAGFDQQSFIQYWNKLAEINKDIEIIDASESALSCFPKIPLERIVKGQT
tara:strand:+ start:59619 stop:60320 length:702 start_codon:yes stop_codon:yes gene_type:complete